MKKRWLMALFIGILALTAVACSKAEPAEDSATEVKELKKQIEELKTENESLKQEIETQKKAAKEEETQELQQSQEPEEIESDSKEVKKLKKGDTIETDNVSITLNKVELIYDVLPDNIDGLYEHYEAKKGNVYIAVDIDVKNLQKQNLSCEDVMTVTADYDSGYSYSGFAVVKDNTTGFTYASITSISPLESMGMKYLIDCPQEVEESDKPLYLLFEVEKQTYKYVIR